MLKIKKQDFIRFVEVEGRNLSLTRAEMFCDTSDDLPAVDDIDGCILDMGSIAYDIATGDFYVLNSDGEWKNSQREEVNVSLNSSALDEQIIQIKGADDEENELEIPELKEEGAENNGELIPDIEGE